MKKQRKKKKKRKKETFKKNVDPHFLKIKLFSILGRNNKIDCSF